MFFRATALLILAAAAALPADRKEIGVARGENEDLIVTATLYASPADVKDLLGSDLGGHFVVADIKVEPKYGKSASVSRDDFVLRNLDNYEGSTPFAPSQIAGRAALVVKRTTDTQTDENGKKSKRDSSISRDGLSGTGSPYTEVGDPNLSAKLENGDAPKDNALEKLLTEKELPEKTSDKPISGLLYFAFDKIKLKNMQLEYGPRGNRLEMKFKADR